MNKQELIAKIVKDTGLTKVGATGAVESLLDGITKSLKKGNAVTFVGFGTFQTSMRKARTARNPQTGASVKVPKRRVVRFKAGKAPQGLGQLIAGGPSRSDGPGRLRRAGCYSRRWRVRRARGRRLAGADPVSGTAAVAEPPRALTHKKSGWYTDRSRSGPGARNRRVAQGLERLLDTQEVGGSIPLVPTIPLCRDRGGGP